MIGLDTNTIVRLLVQDDAAQLRRVQKAIGKHCSETEPGFINSVVLVEVVWVLSSVYKYTREEIVPAIEAILQVKELKVQNDAEAWKALRSYEESTVGFADFYLGAINKSVGCTTTLTFDKKAARTEAFDLVL